jgi:hypothetical protein
MAIDMEVKTFCTVNWLMPTRKATERKYGTHEVIQSEEKHRKGQKNEVDAFETTQK